jgi:hypothetical protein
VLSRPGLTHPAMLIVYLAGEPHRHVGTGAVVNFRVPPAAETATIWCVTRRRAGPWSALTEPELANRSKLTSWI